jgi:hypothetical protein
MLLCVTASLWQLGKSSQQSSRHSSVGLIEELVRNMNQSCNSCYENLTIAFKKQFVKLDISKRVKLALESMICHFKTDGRVNDLKVFEGKSESDILQSLEGDNLSMYTTIFTGVDSICYHLANEAQLTANRESAGQIFNASLLATEFLIQSKDKLHHMTDQVVEQLNEVKNRMDEEQRRVNETRSRIVDSFEQFQKSRGDVMFVHGSLANFKYYGIGILAAFALSFAVVRVFIPVIALTGFFLFVEVICQSAWSWFKGAYAAACLLIMFVAIWRAVLPIRTHLRAREGHRNGLAIPAFFATPIRQNPHVYYH